MKTIHLTATLFLLCSFLSFAQDQKMMFDKIIPLDRIENIVLFSNENTLIALQSDLTESRSIYNFKITRMDTDHVDELMLKYDKTRTHVFFGGHFSDDNFVIYEAEYSTQDQLLIINSHTLYAYNIEFKTTIIHKARNFVNPATNFKMVQSDNQKHKALCYMPDEKTMATLLLSLDNQTVKQNDLRPLAKLSLLFDFQATMSNAGILSLLVEYQDLKGQKFSLISTNLIENKETQNTNLLLDKSAILQSTKLFYNNETLELYALVREGRKDKTTKLFYWQTIPMASKETRAVPIKKFEGNAMSSIHSLITLPNGSAAICISGTKKLNEIIKNPEYQITEDLSPEEKQTIQNKLEMLERESPSKHPKEEERMREISGEKQYLSVVFLDKNKELAWVQNMPECSTSSSIYSASSHSYYIWANSDQLICVYNAEVATRISKPSNTFSSDITANSNVEIKIVPKQRIFNTKDGTFQDHDLMKVELLRGEMFIPKSTRIANTTFAWMFFHMPNRGLVPYVFSL